MLTQLVKTFYCYNCKYVSKMCAVIFRIKAVFYGNVGQVRPGNSQDNLMFTQLRIYGIYRFQRAISMMSIFVYHTVFFEHSLPKKQTYFYKLSSVFRQSVLYGSGGVTLREILQQRTTNLVSSFYNCPLMSFCLVKSTGMLLMLYSYFSFQLYSYATSPITY